MIYKISLGVEICQRTLIFQNMYVYTACVTILNSTSNTECTTIYNLAVHYPRVSESHACQKEPIQRSTGEAACTCDSSTNHIFGLLVSEPEQHCKTCVDFVMPMEVQPAPLILQIFSPVLIAPCRVLSRPD